MRNIGTISNHAGAIMLSERSEHAAIWFKREACPLLELRYQHMKSTAEFVYRYIMILIQYNDAMILIQYNDAMILIQYNDATILIQYNDATILIQYNDATILERYSDMCV